MLKEKKYICSFFFYLFNIKALQTEMHLKLYYFRKKSLENTENKALDKFGIFK